MYKWQTYGLQLTTQIYSKLQTLMHVYTHTQKESKDREKADQTSAQTSQLLNPTNHTSAKSSQLLNPTKVTDCAKNKSGRY